MKYHWEPGGVCVYTAVEGLWSQISVLIFHDTVFRWFSRALTNFMVTVRAVVWSGLKLFQGFIGFYEFCYLFCKFRVSVLWITIATKWNCLTFRKCQRQQWSRQWWRNGWEMKHVRRREISRFWPQPSSEETQSSSTSTSKAPPNKNTKWTWIQDWQYIVDWAHIPSDVSTCVTKISIFTFKLNFTWISKLFRSKVQKDPKDLS